MEYGKIILSNQNQSGCSFCSCENCRHDINSCAGICGYHADLVQPAFQFKQNIFRSDIDAIFAYLNGGKLNGQR